ncbi:arylsulfatase [Kineobactrum salinum]|uniref:Arylsulfatase n=2 Tax=Kineobactrum salinum TaxID=2708301 RepID=A0A6C0U5U3_9GAMM|nr:arylsulfatase [Kineobactrum salinum]
MQLYLVIALVASLAAGFPPAAAQPSVAEQVLPDKPLAQRPNFLVIVADDLGWSDLGSFGGEIATPNLDALAYSGVRFSGFHTAPACSPTRAMLMSGVDNHQAGLGTMAELPNQATRGVPGYETYLNDRVATIAELLHAGGYRTLMSGKWHLGMTPDRGPSVRGFEQSFALLDGASNHFGTDQSRAWREAGFAPTYRENGRPARFPEGAYSSDYFTDRLIRLLEDGAGQANDSRPFFAYLAFTAPHWPIQAPQKDIAKYKGRYDGGYEVLSRARLARQKRLGLVPLDAVPHAMELARPWDSLSTEEKEIEARKMEVYAAMVDRMDWNIGRLVAALKRLGWYNNTLVLFLADNGPDGREDLSPDHLNNLPPAPEIGVDNGLENIGNATSYVSYGPGWAQANSTPSRLMKGYPTEGGIRVAAFAAGKLVKGGGRILNANLDVRDVAPTLLDLAGLSQPARFAGRPILPYEGRSMRKVLNGRMSIVRSADEPLGYELLYRRALRKGDWKAVFLPKPEKGAPVRSVGEGRWQLFNIADDPGETSDLADLKPAKLQELVADYESYAREKGVVPLYP